jgi:hypothetical protein
MPLSKKPMAVLSLVTLGLLSDCSQQTSNPVDLREFTDRRSGSFAVQSLKTVVISNPLGPVRVDGLGADSTVHWFLYSSVYAETERQAIPILAGISLRDLPDGDTLLLSVKTTGDPQHITAVVSLSLPFRTDCVIEQVLGTTDVSYLGGDLHGQSVSITEVNNHSGSVFLEGSGGDISVEVTMPDSGQCIVHTLTGNIALRIPQSTSAQFSASTPAGTITYYGLTFTGIVSTTTSFSGILGSGRGMIQLSTGNGNINVDGFSMMAPQIFQLLSTSPTTQTEPR